MCFISKMILLPKTVSIVLLLFLGPNSVFGSQAFANEPKTTLGNKDAEFDIPEITIRLEIHGIRPASALFKLTNHILNSSVDGTKVIKRQISKNLVLYDVTTHSTIADVIRTCQTAKLGTSKLIVRNSQGNLVQMEIR